MAENDKLSSEKTIDDLSRFRIPEGYTLVPTETYKMLLNQAGQQPQIMKTRLNQEEQGPVILLKVLRRAHLGDISEDLLKGDIIEWIPRRSITIRGNSHKKLTSFLLFWNKQDRRSPKFDRNFEPVFEPLDKTLLNKVLGSFERELQEYDEDTSERIRKEEENWEPRRSKKEDVDDFQDEDQSKAKVVAKRELTPEEQEDRRRRLLGQTFEDPNSFQLTQTKENIREVSTIPGKSAKDDTVDALPQEERQVRRRK